jgi:predicted ATP-dependent protease
LTGKQGILIPESNIKNLMLRHDVIDAVAEGKFAIYPIRKIDEGIELLMDMPAGAPDEDGIYPENTVNGLVQSKLIKMANQRAEFGKSTKEI